jgi:hypothetical protein
MSKTNPNDFSPKNWWLSIVFWVFLVAEFFCIGFVVMYWKELQSAVDIPKNEAVLQAAFGNSIVLGFIRSLLIFLTPLLAYLVLALSTRILYAKNFRFAGVEVGAMAERLNETELDLEKIQDYPVKNEQITRQVLELVIDSVKQKGGKKK